jgi:Uma2 family endonuclease
MLLLEADRMTSATSPTDARPITGEELAELPNLGPCELVEGRIVPMSPTGGEHGRIEGSFYRAIDAFAKPRRLGKVLVGEVGIFTRRNPDTVRGADVAFVSNERYARLDSMRGFLKVAPDLVVEVLSPHEPAAETARKVAEYLTAGVLLVWVADPEARTVRVHRSATDVRTFGAADRLQGEDVLPGFDVLVAELFAE